MVSFRDDHEIASSGRGRDRCCYVDYDDNDGGGGARAPRGGGAVLLKLNVEAYPNSANVYDSLGEAYFVSGNTPQAIQNCEKSLTLDPANKHAAMMLKKLKGQ